MKYHFSDMRFKFLLLCLAISISPVAHAMNFEHDVAINTYTTPFVLDSNQNFVFSENGKLIDLLNQNGEIGDFLRKSDLREFKVFNSGPKRYAVATIFGKSGCMAIFDITNPDIKTAHEIKAKFFENGLDLGCITGYAENLGLADFNGDGLLDILYISYERNYIFINQGNNQFESRTPAWLVMRDKQPRVEGSYIADLFNDGNKYILVADTITKVLPDLTYEQVFVPAEYKIPDEGIAAADLDNDGILEIIKLYPGSTQIYIYKSDLALKKLRLSKIIDLDKFFKGVSESFGLDVADMNSDGLSDIVIAGGRPEGRLPTVLINQGALNFLPVSTGKAPAGFSAIVMARDVNGDQVPDIVSKLIYSPANLRGLDNREVNIPGRTLTYFQLSKLNRLNNVVVNFFEKNINQLAGSNLRLTSKKGNQRVFPISLMGGYLFQPSSSVAFALDKDECPYTVDIKGNQAILKCNGEVDYVGNSNRVFEIQLKWDRHAYRNFLPQPNDWSRKLEQKDMVKLESSGDSLIMLGTGENKRGFVRADVSGSCSRFRLKVGFEQGKTPVFARMRHGDLSYRIDGVNGQIDQVIEPLIVFKKPVTSFNIEVVLDAPGPKAEARIQSSSMACLD